MRIAVIGAGGVGGYFGARLAAAGNDVVFVARGAHFEAIKGNGLTVRSPLGDLDAIRVSVVSRVAEVGKADLVIVAVKLWDTEHVAEEIRPLVEDGADVISFQNGVLKDELLARHLPRASLMGGACYISAVIEAPGVIRHNGTIQRLVFGEYDHAASARSSGFLDACLRSGIDAQISEDIERELWEKYVFLVGLSATTSAIRLPIGAILANDRSRDLLRGVMQEVLDLGRARGVKLDDSFVEQRLAFCQTLPPDLTSSMYNDLVRGNRLELPWLSGGVAAAAKELGIPAPRNQTIAEILAPYENPTHS